MAYLSEQVVRKAASSERLTKAYAMDSAAILKESLKDAKSAESFDVFLCHSINDAELVHGAKRILEERGLSVYVDWMVDPQMNRSSVSAETARILRSRLDKSKSLLYLYSNNSTRSRWMPWELGYFDGSNGTVGVLPIVPTSGQLDFSKEEYLGLYPKIEFSDASIFVNRTIDAPVPATDKTNYRSFKQWVDGSDKLKF